MLVLFETPGLCLASSLSTKITLFSLDQIFSQFWIFEQLHFIQFINIFLLLYGFKRFLFFDQNISSVAGFALFKLHDDGKLENVETLFDSFKNVESAKKLYPLSLSHTHIRTPHAFSQLLFPHLIYFTYWLINTYSLDSVSLLAFRKFEDTADALSAATAIVEGKLSKNLKKFLTKSIIEKDLKEKLAVADAKLKTLIREKLGIETVHDDAVLELFRCIRFQLKSLLSDNLTDSDMNSMALGLAHSLSRYKIKFSPDKVDIMIVQAICRVPLSHTYTYTHTYALCLPFHSLLLLFLSSGGV